MNAPERQLRVTQERGSTQQQEQHDQHETQPTSGMHRSDLQFEDVCYPFWIGSRCTDEIAQHLASMSPSSLHIVTDETVNALHVRPLARRLQEFARVSVWPITVGEKSKSLRTLERLAHDVLEARIDRQGVVVAMGGGVVGNVAGLLAALLFRGIRLVHVPTTLMAMSDSVISLKQAVNMPQGKNLIGCSGTHAWYRIRTRLPTASKTLTDEPPPEVAAAGHDRCIIPIKPENVDAWLAPETGNLAAQYAILDDRERPYYEHRLAAQGEA